MTDDLRRALADLADAAGTGAGWDPRAVDARVSRLVQRVRRRRAAVTATASATALGTVGVLAVVAAALSGHLGTTAPADPPPATGPTPSQPTTTEPTAGPPRAPAGPAAALFACGRPAPESIHTLPDQGHLTVAPDLTTGTWDASAPPDLAVTVGATGGYRVTAEVGNGWLALVDDSGVVVGFVVPDDRSAAPLALEPDGTQELTTTTTAAPCDAHEPLTGTYVAWPFVEATEVVAELAGSSDEQPAVAVVANPQQVTFAG